MTQQAAATFSTYHLMPALKSLILYRMAEPNTAMMKEKMVDNALAASQNTANMEAEMRSIAQQLNRLQDVRRQIQGEMESMEKDRAAQLYNYIGMM